MSADSPFWFAQEDLLTDLLQAEIHSIRELFAKHPDLRDFFDFPEATMSQRAACFLALAHRATMDEIYETFAGRYEQSPSLGDEEKDALWLTRSLFDSDGPAWVLELGEVVELLPSRIYGALPEPLRRGGFKAISDNAAEVEIIGSAASRMSNVEEIQALTRGVLGQQLQRLEARWSASSPATNVVRRGSESKRKGRRTRDEQRVFRDKLIAEIDDVAPTPIEFVTLMDERRVQPQPTWNRWPGSWSQAYKDRRLRKLIHQDKSRALARVRRERNR
jgi:hypothetical protein